MTFEQILDSKGIRHEQGSPGWVNILCVFCESRGKQRGDRPLLGVNVKEDCCNCLHCGFALRKNGVEKVLEALRIEETVDGARRQEPKRVEPEVKLPAEYVRLHPVPTDRLLHEAYSYLRNRGVSDTQITKKRVGVCLSGRYAYRVVFPVVSEGELRGFVARDFTGRQKVPYLNSFGPKAVYNLRRNKKNVALLFEGILKCLAAERVLSEDADCLAVLGKSVTDEQVEMLRGYKRVVVVPDNDGPGLRGSLKMARKLVDEGFNVEVARLDRRFKDCDEAYVAHNLDAVRSLVVNAQPYNAVLVSRIRAEAAWDYRSRG